MIERLFFLFLILPVAILSCTKSKPKKATPPETITATHLDDQLDSDDPEVRWQGLKLVKRLPKDEQDELYIDFLRSHRLNAKERVYAKKELAKIVARNDGINTKQLIEKLQVQKDAQSIRQAIGYAPFHPVLIEVLLPYLEKQNANYTPLAIVHLAEMRHPKLQQHYAALVLSKSRVISGTALKNISRACPNQAHQLVVQSLVIHNDEEFVVVALKALGNLGGPQALVAIDKIRSERVEGLKNKKFVVNLIKTLKPAVKGSLRHPACVSN